MRCSAFFSTQFISRFKNVSNIILLTTCAVAVAGLNISCNSKSDDTSAAPAAPEPDTTLTGDWSLEKLACAAGSPDGDLNNMNVLLGIGKLAVNWNLESTTAKVVVKIADTTTTCSGTFFYEALTSEKGIVKMTQSTTISSKYEAIGGNSPCSEANFSNYLVLLTDATWAYKISGKSNEIDPNNALLSYRTCGSDGKTKLIFKKQILKL